MKKKETFKKERNNAKNEKRKERNLIEAGKNQNRGKTKEKDGNNIKKGMKKKKRLKCQN